MPGPCSERILYRLPYQVCYGVYAAFFDLPRSCLFVPKKHHGVACRLGNNTVLKVLSSHFAAIFYSPVKYSGFPRAIQPLLKPSTDSGLGDLTFIIRVSDPTRMCLLRVGFHGIAQRHLPVSKLSHPMVIKAAFSSSSSFAAEDLGQLASGELVLNQLKIASHDLPFFVNYLIPKYVCEVET